MFARYFGASHWHFYLLTELVPVRLTPSQQSHTTLLPHSKIVIFRGDKSNQQKKGFCSAELIFRMSLISPSRAVAYTTAFNAFNDATFVRCNAASAASNVAIVADSAADLTKCYIANSANVDSAGPACIAAETRTMLAAYPGITVVREACILAGVEPPPNLQLPHPREFPQH